MATSEGKGLTDPVLLTGLGFNKFFHDTTVGRECMVQQLGSGKPYDVHMRTGPNILELAYLDSYFYMQAPAISGYHAGTVPGF